MQFALVATKEKEGNATRYDVVHWDVWLIVALWLYKLIFYLFSFLIFRIIYYLLTKILVGFVFGFFLSFKNKK